MNWQTLPKAYKQAQGRERGIGDAANSYTISLSQILFCKTDLEGSTNE
jgi:hypothetical protein